MQLFYSKLHLAHKIITECNAFYKAHYISKKNAVIDGMVSTEPVFAKVALILKG